MPASERAAGRSYRQVGLILVTLVAVPALMAPLLSGGDMGNVVGAPWADASLQHPLGLDNLGRDMANRLMWSARTSLCVSLVATLLAFVVGTSLGALVAVRGRWVEKVADRVVDLLMALPPLIFALVVLSIAGTSLASLVFTVAIMSATRFFRVSRTLAASVVVQPYFEIAIARKERLTWLIFHEVLPNIVKPLLAQSGLQLCSALLLVASLGFLGFGLAPPLTDLGSVVRENAPALGFGLWAPLFPAITIALFISGINLLIDAVSGTRSRS
jgi:peptide/nickel transport system permease protein